MVGAILGKLVIGQVSRGTDSSLEPYLANRVNAQVQGKGHKAAGDITVI